ncbi:MULTISPECIES: adenylate/guanylate cyclase domain-containing protein [unclassified Oceanobacter]|uniref:adenylate/guanylate cyclase domain-containing protein n=1 Tax=unclassified Oceanobacter TaxID=2620260 RepID=UPI0027330C77|nr:MULTISPECIES: adenylate/guanylate cyclase domain-containing protein [unclassified Oceanobacter]MDP2608965.1 adenylate/guanylate cyclase domain-containing protein [Oceanobacter sp. 1_MG-2023]MDP2612050.1 adenylate/guanylate cyclase domain-containing protein [Oceanobacter sp. 2_MG-2023]
MQLKLPCSFHFSLLCGCAAATQVLIFGLLLAFLTYSNLSNQLEQRLEQDATQQTQRLAMTLAHSLIQRDRISLNLALTEWHRGEEISALRVLDTDGVVIAEIGKTLDDRINISRSITQDNQVVGIIQADINLAPARRDSGHYLSLALIATGLGAMLAGLAGYFLAEQIAHYLQQLSRALKNSRHNQPLQLPPPPAAIEEFEQLHGGLSVLRDDQRHRQAMAQALGQFRYQGTPPSGQTLCYQHCALIYIEMTELATLQAQLDTDELVQLLNEYHRLLNQAAKLYNGKLDHYQDDGVVMIFGLNDESERDTLHCVYAAQLCLGLMRNASQKNPQLADIRFRVAAHWGPVLLTPTDSADDSHGHRLVGDSLYWASTLARRSEAFRLLASQALISALPPEYGLEWEAGAAVPDLNGDNQPGYWLTTLPEKSQALIDRQILRIANMAGQA